MKRQHCIKCGKYHDGKVRKAGYILADMILCYDCDPNVMKIRLEKDIK